MSMIPGCVVCDRPISPYGGDCLCERCSQPCPTCGGDVARCVHPLPQIEAQEALLDLTVQQLACGTFRVAA